MGKFVGRKAELSKLEEIWSSDHGKAVVMYGRRRVGKSSILGKFCSGRRAVYIECVQGSLDDNLRLIAGVLGSLDGVQREYRYIGDALDDVESICRSERTVVVFDELPYLLSTGEHVASTLQHFMDHIARDTDSMVIMCGSSVSVMKRETTDYDRPLYGRFDHRMEIMPMRFDECSEFHPDMSDIDRLMLYLTVGGMPKYHNDSISKDYRSYVIRHFLSSDGDLRDEAESILSMEFVPRDRYLAIVNAISDGRTSQKDIIERTKLEKSMCIRCLESLSEVGIIDTIHPMMGAPKRPVYRIKDNMVAFCQDVVMASRSHPLEDPERKYDILEQRIHSFLGRRFEDFCMDYVTRHWPCLEIGKWWGPDSERQIREIDIVATVLEGDVKVSLYGECKFVRSMVAYSTYNKLRDVSDLTNDSRTRRYVMFSVSEFDDKLEEDTGAGHVTLVGLEDLVRG